MERPEHRLLLACIRSCAEAERRRLLEDCLASGVDWPYLLQAAARHALTSQLYWQTRRLDGNLVPPVVSERLRLHFTQNTAFVLLSTARLRQNPGSVRCEGYTCDPVQGPVLAHSLYENPGLREFGDLDIIVERPNVLTALSLLCELGYERPREYSAGIWAEILKRNHHYSVSRPDGTDTVEIHWHLVDYEERLPIPLERWWARAEPGEAGTTPFRSFSAEDQLVALCVHGATHLWASLRWVADVARLVERHPSLDWEYVWHEHGHPDLRRILALGVLAASDLAAAPVPDAVLNRARADGVARGLCDDVRSCLFRPERSSSELSATLHALRFQGRLRTSWTGRIAYFGRTLLAPTRLELDRARPETLLPLYFLLRPMRLLGKHASRLVHRPRRERGSGQR